MGSLLLDSIHQPSDLKQLDHQQIVQLCEEIFTGKHFKNGRPPGFKSWHRGTDRGAAPRAGNAEGCHRL